MAIAIDNTAEFMRMMHPPYDNFDDFQRDLSVFQHATATSFFIWSSRTAASWYRASGEQLPGNIPYKYAKFTCVHAKRRKHCSKFVDYACPASFVLHARSGKFQIEKATLIHSHSFHVGQPSIYPKNRRLLKDDEQEVMSLIDGSGSLLAVQKFISDRYDRHLNRADMQRMLLRQRNKRSYQEDHSPPVDEEMSPTMSPHKVKKEAIEKVQRSTDFYLPNPAALVEYDDSLVHTKNIAKQDEISACISAGESGTNSRVKHLFLNDEQMLVIKNLIGPHILHNAERWTLHSDGHLTKLVASSEFDDLSGSPQSSVDSAHDDSSATECAEEGEPGDDEATASYES